MKTVSLKQINIEEKGGLEKVLKVAIKEGIKIIEVEINGVRARSEAFGKKAEKK